MGKEIGEKNVTKEEVERIQTIIEESQERNLINENLKNAPIWIQKIMIQK